MTKAQIITSIRSLCDEVSTDAGAFLEDANNVTDFADDAAEIVVLDLVEFMPERFLIYEDISLLANTAGYALTAEWLQIWSLNRNKTSEAPTPINHVDIQNVLNYMYVGETAEEPEAWYLKGTQINFVPTPSVAKTNYARAWIVAPEAATIATAGPTMIPRIAHRLVVYMACILVGKALEASVSSFTALYQYRLKKIRDVIGAQVQQQPRFLNPSVYERSLISTRDRAFYDYGGSDFFGR